MGELSIVQEGCPEKKILYQLGGGAVPIQEIIGRCRLLDSFPHIILRLLNIDDDLDKDGDCVDEVATGDKSDGAWPAEHRQSLDDNDDDDNDNDDDR